MLKHLVAAAVLLLASLSSTAQPAYPARSVRLIVPWPAGGGADAVGRAVAASLTRELGATVYVDNIAGAGGNIGTQQFARSPADGYTLILATSSTNSANPYLYKRLGFDPVRDFAPVALVGVIPSVLVVPDASPFRSATDIVAAAKANPGKLSYGSGGVGASAHLAGELFKSVAKIDVTHVPYKGSGPALTDVMGGQLDFMLDTGAFPFIKGGKIRALAVASDRRHPLLPGVPTFAEIGIKGMVMNAWYGVAAPAGTPPAIVARVNAAVDHALSAGDLSKRLSDIGAEIRSGSPEDFTRFWNSELQRYAALVKLTGATLD